MSENHSYKPNRQPSDRSRFRQRPLLSLPQLLILASIVFGVYIGFDLNRRALAGAQMETNETAMIEKVNLEKTRQVELVMTREYVKSDAYVEDYARNEAGQLKPGENRIVPLLGEVTPVATPIPTATPDPAYDARPWQAWWRLFTDAPMPSN
jgi:cell division protein FtsB